VATGITASLGGIMGLVVFMVGAFGFIFAIEKTKNSAAGVPVLLAFTFFMGLMLSRMLATVLGTAAARFHGIRLQWPVDLDTVAITEHRVCRFELAKQAKLVARKVDLGEAREHTTGRNRLDNRRAVGDIQLYYKAGIGQRIADRDAMCDQINHRRPQRAYKKTPQSCRLF
jgi:hypothetical protein